MGYEAGNPVSQIESRVLCFFYPVRNLVSNGVYPIFFVRDRVSNGVDPDFLSISLGTMRKGREKIETAMHMSQE